MQQRSALKPLWPLFWSNSVCSHPRKGETCELAAERRLQEELAVSAELRMLFQFEYSAEFGSVGAEHELCKVYSACVDIDYPIVANENEIADWEWIAIDELESRIATSPELYTPWLLMEWSRIRSKGYRDLQSATAVVVR
jgi:isopentenyl-diphosphate delta-isomerase